MSDLNVLPDALHRIANGMRGSTAGLAAAAKQSVSEINAGISTPEVQMTIAALARATAGLLDGTMRTADDVSEGRADYTKTDEGAGENMPRVDGGN